ncbi:MAG: cyclic nucleotide-binding domain-containing protein [Pseudomonadota bacterium]
MWEALTAPQNLVLTAGIIFTLGYLLINQVVLRLFMLTGTAFYIWYYWTVADAPLWEAIFTSFMMGTANLIGLFVLYARGAAWSVPKAHRDLYERFNTLPPGDFRALLREANRLQLEEATVITREGQPNDCLYYVISGGASITKRGHAFKMPSGVFFGEASYLLNGPAAATITLDAGSEVLEWRRDRVAKIAKRKPRFKLALDASIARDMAVKIVHAVAPQDANAKPTAAE